MFQSSLKSRLLNRLNAFLPLLGFILIALGIAWAVLYQSYFKQAVFYQNEVVLKKEAHTGDVINASMLKIIKVEKSTLGGNVVQDPSQIDGLAAAQNIPANIQLSQTYFDKSELTLSNDKYVFDVPKEWIFSVANSMRRGDMAYFYEVNASAENAVSNYVNNNNYNQKPPANTTVDSTSNNASTTQNSSSSTSQTLPTHNTTNQNSMVSELDKPIIKTPVAYVKDSSNKEVVTLSTGNASNGKRLDGSGVIADLEVVITPKQYQQLKDSADQGNKFIIMYGKGGN